MERIDETMLNALRQAVETAGSQSEFARRAGIGKQHISKYLRGEIKNMEHDTWMKLLPFIREFMPTERLVSFEEHKSWIKNNDLPSGIPVITLIQASGFDSTLESFDDYARAQDHGTAPLLEDKSGMLAIRMTGNSACSWYSPGTIVYLSCHDYPRPGKRVIAKLKDDGEVVFRIFYRKDNRVMLLSTDGSGNDFIWEKPGENPFSWIYPIKYSFRDEDSADSEIHGVEHSWKERINNL